MTSGLIAPAQSDEMPRVRALLESAELPLAGVDEHVSDFLVARDGDRLLGCIGLETYGDAGLLRSLAVHPDARGRGVGRRLIDRLFESARDRGVSTMYLLTTTADRYFPRFGFEAVPRDSVDPRLNDSEELKGACPDSAVLMRRRL